MDAELPVFSLSEAVRRPEADRRAALRDPGFGRVFTDHMAIARFAEGRGWHDIGVVPLADFSLHPAAIVLHYAQIVFEGLKAYRLPDGGAALFRPWDNARRLQNSAARLAMVAVPDAIFVESVRALVRADRDWIPEQEGASLYLRPFLVSTEPNLGLKASTDFLYCVIASPVAPIFGASAAPLQLWISEDYTRAASGGTGAAKCGGNYAGGLLALAEARREGCDQAVFLDAAERRWIEELGGMNVFFVFADGTLRTPPLGGTILPGITRDSLIVLARAAGLTVEEAPYAIEAWQQDAESGRLTEAFACGTAAIVAPIGRVRGRSRDFRVGGGAAGAVTLRLKAALEDIQRGRAPDRHGWVDRVV